MGHSEHLETIKDWLEEEMYIRIEREDQCSINTSSLRHLRTFPTINWLWVEDQWKHQLPNSIDKLLKKMELLKKGGWAEII